MNRLMGVNLFRGKGGRAIRAGCLSPAYEVLLSLIGPSCCAREAYFCRWDGSRTCCKCFGELFGVCGTSASVTKSFLAFAELPQVSQRTFWRLRNFRKCLEELFGVCGTSASVAENFLAFAELPQASRRTFWRLRNFRKHFQRHFGRYDMLSETCSMN